MAFFSFNLDNTNGVSQEDIHVLFVEKIITMRYHMIDPPVFFFFFL